MGFIRPFIGAPLCHALRWGVEVLLHRYFAASACRTMDPEEAGSEKGGVSDV